MTSIFVTLAHLHNFGDSVKFHQMFDFGKISFSKKHQNFCEFSFGEFSFGGIPLLRNIVAPKLLDFLAWNMKETWLCKLTGIAEILAFLVLP